MNALDAYRRSMVVAPPHTQLAKLHEQACIFTQNVAHFAKIGDVESARKNIQYVQDIITFLRSSLDMSIEVSGTADSVYAFYYRVLAKWYVDISETPPEYPSMLDFWKSWAETWTAAAQVQSL